MPLQDDSREGRPRVRGERKRGHDSLETMNYGFTTCIQIRVRDPLDADRAERVGASVQAFLNLHAGQIQDLVGVTVRQTPSIKLDGNLIFLPLELHTGRDLPFYDKMRLARDVVIFARGNVALPEIEEVLDDEAPSIATVGF
jgi:hypothetical protein